MSQTQSKPQPMDVSRADEARVRAELAATAQYLSFEPGLYAVDFQAAKSATTDVGLRLPCLRLEAIPPSGRQVGRAFINTVSDGGWIWRGNEPTFVLVVGGPAGVVLTIYKASDGMPSPQVRIRYIGAQGVTPAPARPAAPAPIAIPEMEPVAGAVPISSLVHVRGIGDVKTTGTNWTGRPGGGAAVEGFAIMPIGVIGEGSLEYQAVLGNNWNTPWFSAGEFCGSRGLALELLGFRVRLTDATAVGYECAIWGSFVGKPEVGPITDGEVCEAEGAPLEAIRVVITPRANPVGAAALDPKPARKRK